MEEMNGYLAAIEALGDKIIALQESLRFAGYKEDNLESELAKSRQECARLEELNEMLTKKLANVKGYIAEMEEKRNA